MLTEEIVCVIAKLLDLTVFASFNETTSVKAFMFRGHRLALWPKCEETECSGAMS